VAVRSRRRAYGNRRREPLGESGSALGDVRHLGESPTEFYKKNRGSQGYALNATMVNSDGLRFKRGLDNEEIQTPPHKHNPHPTTLHFKRILRPSWLKSQKMNRELPL